MKDEIRNDIEKYAQILGISIEQANADYTEIVAKHNLDTETEDGLKIARGLLRAKFSQQKAMMKKEAEGETKEYDGPTYTQNVTGFFYAVEDARNWEENRRTRLLAEYNRDAHACLESGEIALAVLLEDNRYEVTKAVNEELDSRVMETIPDSAMQVDDDRWIIPVDNRKAWGDGQPNPNYGKPTPAENWSRRLFLVAKLGEGEYQKYQLSMKGEHCKDFIPDTFRLCTFDCIPSSNSGSLLHARKDGSTANSLQYLESSEDIVTLIQTVLSHELTPLIMLGNHHSENSHLKAHEKMLITDGNVTNMILQPYSNGNRLIHVSDFNTDADFDNDGHESVSCWIPEHINIDFGIGSEVIICGRTSQGTDKEGVLRDVSLNVLGLFAIKKFGSADMASEVPVVEELTGWW